MIEKIQLALINESGDFIPLKNTTTTKNFVDFAVSDAINECKDSLNAIADEEIQQTEKFFFALELRKLNAKIKELITDADQN